jgi:hyperosmotically inducible protein
MKYKSLVVVITLFALVTLGFTQNRDQPSVKGQERIIKAVRHEILMLPYYGAFDDIKFKVEGYTVTLLGAVSQPQLKSDAENVVKRVEGVEKVDNQIEVLPNSPADERLRRELYRAIYRYPALERYGVGVQKPIRILVRNGHVTLEGFVDNEGDKNFAFMRANGVPGIFSVTNNLQVEK